MDTTVPQNEEKQLTLKSLQNHFVKALFGALAVAMISAFITSYVFYFNTNNNLDELNQNKSETKQDIKDLKKDVADIKMSLSNTTFYTTDNKERVKSLESEISDIRKQQDEMLKVLYEIKAKVK
jgi:septal ring factor EnvC (AmiA/AmiB activator)